MHFDGDRWIVGGAGKLAVETIGAVNTADRKRRSRNRLSRQESSKAGAGGDGVVAHLYVAIADACVDDERRAGRAFAKLLGSALRNGFVNRVRSALRLP